MLTPEYAFSYTHWRVPIGRLVYPKPNSIQHLINAETVYIRLRLK